ncbi:hypothetical protein ACFQZQ_01275 [Lysobacter koreensis]|uniref:Beta-barrel assembly machine subunit BamC n=1 Tax=Lysobacter koreensis TaxID=266122 RepID=A0ABW2YHJ7_9GAMM
MSVPVPVSLPRAAVAGLLVVGLLGASGCSWFRKGDKLYAQSAESRPLEVPPDLDLPRSDGAMGVPSGSVTASGQASAAPMAPAAAAGTAATPASSTIGFTTPGSRDEVFNKVGDALAKVGGVNVASRAQLLGAFDVNYEGSNFLVRVSAADAGAYVSAVDPRGLPATGEPPAKLIAALKAAIGGN